MNCKNCHAEVTQNYCPQCGQVAQLKRIDGHYIVAEIGEILNFDRGILFTVKELLIRPGENVQSFLSTTRSRLVKPVIFIIITSLIYSLTNHFFGIEDGYVNYQEVTPTATGYIFTWVQEHYGYANIIMGVFIAFWTQLFFRKYGYNFFEILILLCFVMGMGMLFYATFALFQGLTDIDLMQIGGIIGFLYVAWAMGQFFDKSKFANYVKAFFAYMLGFLTFTVTALLVGQLIEFISN
tara:strand:+ start:20400 stop:21113 length:714 start_codon:yes stop_codon:yes gene_type:complete